MIYQYDNNTIWKDILILNFYCWTVEQWTSYDYHDDEQRESRVKY